MFSLLHKYLYKKLILPLSVDEDSKRKEFILNIILFSSLILLCLCEYFVIVHSITSRHYRGISPFLFIDLPLLFFILLVLSRAGYFKISSHLLIWIYFISITYAVATWGVDLQVALLGFVIVIFIASILISTRYGFWVTATISITLLIVWYLQYHKIIIPITEWKTPPPGSEIVEFIALFYLIMTLSWLSNRDIEKSLERARKSEQALKEERDILEVKIEERTSALRQTQVEQMSQLYRFAEFGRLSAGLFHDLINPLSAVTLNINKLELSAAKELTETKTYLDKAMTVTKRMEEFIQAVRKQIQSQELSAIFSLEQEIEQALSLLTYKAQKARVVISTDLEHITIHGNALKFHQISLNLISNAIDSYLNEQAKIHKPISVRLKKINEYAELEVSDKGSGISQSALPHIYEPFFTTKTNESGIGLGLSMTKQIIERDFQGSIHVMSSPHVGSTFIVMIPLNQDITMKPRENQENTADIHYKN